MTIDPFQDDLKSYLDGELFWPRRLAVRVHLTHCASCRKEIKEMTHIAEDLRTSEPADTLDPALRAKILEIAPIPEDIGAGSHRPKPAPKRPALAWVLAGAALVAWFVCYPLFSHRSGDMLASASIHSAGLNVATESSPPAPAALSAPYAPVFLRRPPSPKVKPPPPPKPEPIALRNGAETASAVPTPGEVQTYDLNNPPAGLRPLVGYGAATAGDSLRQVHKEASIGVQVPNPEAVSDTVETMVKETGGYVASNTLSTGDGDLKTAELIVKVPVAQFETFMAQVAKLGSVQSKNISGEDITEKTSDADQTEGVLEDDVQQSEARLKALGAKAKWHDEQATRELRIQLAQARARLVLLKRLAALSTVTIDLSQMPPKAPPPPPPPVTGGFLNGLKATTHDALASLVNSGGALLALAIWLLAYAPIWIPLLLIGRYALREYRKRQMV